MENICIKEIVAYLLGIVGTLLLLGGALVAYIFKRHVDENDCQVKQNYDEHTRMFDKIDCKVDKRWMPDEPDRKAI